MYDKGSVQKLASILDFVIKSEESDFYRGHFAKHVSDIEVFLDFKNFEEIPILTWNDIYAFPFTKRIYTKDNLVTKVTYNSETGRPLLIGRTRVDIAKENFGKLLKRPLILFENSHEGIEKGLWCYENNILPLINPEDIRVTMLASELYHIDSIISEPKMLDVFLENTSSEIIESVIHVSIINSSFDHLEIKKISEEWSLSVTLALPEVGTIAHACKHELAKGKLLFHPNKYSILEYNGVLTITKLIKLPTPIIRYQTNIKAGQVEKSCSCDVTEAFILKENEIYQ